MEPKFLRILLKLIPITYHFLPKLFPSLHESNLEQLGLERGMDFQISQEID